MELNETNSEPNWHKGVENDSLSTIMKYFTGNISWFSEEIEGDKDNVYKN